VHEQAACLPAGKSLAPEKTDTRNRCSPLLRDRRGRHHGRSIWNAPATSIGELAVVSETVNLWDAGTIRGNQPGSLQSVSLPAAVVRVTIILPRFSPPANTLWPLRRIRMEMASWPRKRAGDDQWRPRISVCRTGPAGGQGGSVFSSHDPRTGSGVILLSFANQIDSLLRPLNSRLRSNPGICLGNRLKHSMNANPSWQQMRFVCEFNSNSGDAGRLNLRAMTLIAAPFSLRIAYRILLYSRHFVPFGMMVAIVRRTARARSAPPQPTVSDIGRLVHGIERAVGRADCYPRALMTCYLCLKNGRGCQVVVGTLAPTRKMHAWCSTDGELPYEASPEHYMYRPLLVMTLSP
jgi:hypothetical protein